MKYIESTSHDPYFNLAMEQFVFDEMDRASEYFMLWQNANTVVVGKFQNTAEEVNQAYVDEHDVHVARRLSGGGAVYHDLGNLNYTFIVDQGEAMDFDFKRFAEPVVRALADLGVTAAFTGRNDLTIDGKKFSGSSQYLKHGRIMDHGCIMVDSDLSIVSKVLQPKEAKFISKKSKSVRSRVTTIDSSAESRITVPAFKEALLREIRRSEPLEKVELTEEQLREVERIAEERYRTFEWNYGKEADYSYSNSVKYDFGLVEVQAEIRKSVIEDISIHGDFFGNGEIEDLENALKGERIDEDLDRRIEQKIDIDHYISGMTAADLKDLLR